MNFSDLELLVQADMFERGYDPSLKEEIQCYWEEWYGY
jgi:hypothetical protein